MVRACPESSILKVPGGNCLLPQNPLVARLRYFDRRAGGMASANSLERRPAGLAAAEDGEMTAGVIYDPLRDEMFVAERGRGAWLNGRPIHVSKTASLQEALTATGVPR